MSFINLSLYDDEAVNARYCLSSSLTYSLWRCFTQHDSLILCQDPFALRLRVKGGRCKVRSSS